MNDDLLTTFRSEMPMPDEATTQRPYEGATSGRRRAVTRRGLVVVVAVFAVAGIAAALGLTLGGGGSHGSIQHGPHPLGPGGGMALAPVSMDTHVGNGELTSIDLTLRSVAPANTLDLKVVRSDASQPADADSAPSHTVFT